MKDDLPERYKKEIGSELPNICSFEKLKECLSIAVDALAACRQELAEAREELADMDRMRVELLAVTACNAKHMADAESLRSRLKTVLETIESVIVTLKNPVLSQEDMNTLIVDALSAALSSSPVESMTPGADMPKKFEYVGKCDSCGCGVDKDGHGHHSAADCKYMQEPAATPGPV